MGNSKRPWEILNIDLLSSPIRRCVREDCRSCWRAASFATCRRPFMSFSVSFCTFSDVVASQDRMDCDSWIAYSKFASIKIYYKERKVLGGRAAKDRFMLDNSLRALLAVLTKLSSALSLVLKTIPRSLLWKRLQLSGCWVG